VEADGGGVIGAADDGDQLAKAHRLASGDDLADQRAADPPTHLARGDVDAVLGGVAIGGAGRNAEA